jgi:Universal stress protein family
MEFFSSNPALTIGSSFPFTVGPHANETSAPRGQFREILYATDFSPESLDAAAYAVSLAQEFQSRLVLLHVIQRRRAGDLVSITELIGSSPKTSAPGRSTGGRSLVQTGILRGERRPGGQNSGICHAEGTGSHRSARVARGGRTRCSNASSDGDSAQDRVSRNLSSAHHSSLICPGMSDVEPGVD